MLSIWVWVIKLHLTKLTIVRKLNQLLTFRFNYKASDLTIKHRISCEWTSQGLLISL